MPKILCSVIFFIFCNQKVCTQTDSLGAPKFKARKIFLSTATGVGTVGSLIALNQAWYSEYNTGKFHFFNDNKEWLQMDKVGHVYSAYQTTRAMMEWFEWAGFSKNKKYFFGGSIGLTYLTAIEIMDGFSEGWGFSWGDQFANFGGASLAIAQEAIWNEQKILLKFSFAKSGLAHYNSSLLGSSLPEQILKDYNGQTYWLSVSPRAFFKKTKWLPEYLNIAFGYSAYGMLGGHENRILAQDNNGNVFKIERERRYYLSFDLDLTKIQTKSKVLKAVFSVVNILKIPAPTLQLSSGKLRFYGIYY
jgi:uncharacterized protein YfiM (DUF2279 family)